MSPSESYMCMQLAFITMKLTVLLPLLYLLNTVYGSSYYLRVENAFESEEVVKGFYVK